MKTKTSLSEGARRLTLLINEFLEKQITREELLSSPDKIVQYRTLLRKCLSQKAQMDESTISQLDFGHNDTYEAATGILALHRYMRSFWDIFREVASIPRPFVVLRSMKTKERKELFRNWWETSDGTISDWRIFCGHGSWEDEEEWQLHPLDYRHRAETLDYYLSHVIDDFLDLLTSRESMFLAKCADEKCGRWFIRTAKNKECCSPKCSSRHYQTRFRKERPDEYKEKHDDWVQKNYKKT